MDAAALAFDVAAAASTTNTSPLLLCPWGERGGEMEGEGLQALTGKGVANDNEGRPSCCCPPPASPPLRLSAPLVGWSGSTAGGGLRREGTVAFKCS